MEDQERALRQRLRESLTADEWKRFTAVWRPFRRGEGDTRAARETVRRVLDELEQLYFLYYANTKEAYERRRDAPRQSRAEAQRTEEARIEHENATAEYETVADFIAYFDATYKEKAEEEEAFGEPVEAIYRDLCLYPLGPFDMVRFIARSDENQIAVADRMAAIKGFMPVLERDELDAFPLRLFVPCDDEEGDIDGPVIQYKTVALHRLYRTANGMEFTALTDHERFSALFELIEALADASKRAFMTYDAGQWWDMNLVYEETPEGDERVYKVKSEKHEPIYCHSRKRVTICDYRGARLNAKTKKEAARIDSAALELVRRVMMWFPVANVTQKVLVFLAERKPEKAVKYVDLLSILGSWYRAREFNFDV